MFVMRPLEVNDATLFSSNVALSDYPAWSGATAYTIGQRAYKGKTDYECIKAHTGSDPSTVGVAAGNWIVVGAVNKWKAFDQKLSDPATRASSMQYAVKLTGICNSIALFNVAGVSVRVRVFDTFSALVYDVTKNLVDTSGIIDYFTYATWDGLSYDTEALITNVTAYAGFEIRVDIDATGATAKLGQLVFGNSTRVGETLEGTKPSFQDFSRKEYDIFGNAILIERPFASTVDFSIAVPINDERRVINAISGLRATPCVYYADAGGNNRGTLIYGWPEDFDMPLASGGMSFGTVRIQGLT